MCSENNIKEFTYWGTVGTGGLCGEHVFLMHSNVCSHRHMGCGKQTVVCLEWRERIGLKSTY